MNPRIRAVLWAAAGGVLGAVVVLLATLGGSRVPWAVAVPAGAAVGLLAAVAAALPATDPEVPDVRSADPPRGTSFADLGSLQFAVRDAGADPERLENRLRPRLAALAVERLWQRHRLDWRRPADRTAADALLGPLTKALLTAPPRSMALTPDTLARWLDEMETL